MELTGIERGGSYGRAASPLPAQAVRAAGGQVINLRTLKPLDRDTIVKSVRKTHRLVTAEEGWPQSGVGAELVALVNEEVRSQS